jgi:hypothetical protein
LSAKVGSELAHSGPISRTGRGEHWLFVPGGTANRAGLLTKVDWRGTNGYIVAPPSIHPDGHSYSWDPEHGPDTPLAEVPGWLLPLLAEWEDKPEYVEKPIRVLKTQPYSKNAPQRIIVLDAQRLASLKTNIVQMADELGYHPVRDGGGRFAIHCPFHEGDREPSLKLFPRNNTFYCFGCHAWGDALDLNRGKPGGYSA